MIYLYDYETAKRYHREHIQRSLAKKKDLPIDEYVSPIEKNEADVVEVEFGTWCESQPKGA